MDWAKIYKWCEEIEEEAKNKIQTYKDIWKNLSKRDKVIINILVIVGLIQIIMGGVLICIGL